jgi:hypothetical protein
LVGQPNLVQLEVRKDRFDAPRTVAGPDEKVELVAIIEQTTSKIGSDEARAPREDHPFAH